MMRELVLSGNIVGFKVRGGTGEGVCISHLLFAEDTLVLCGADVNQFGVFGVYFLF